MPLVAPMVVTLILDIMRFENNTAKFMGEVCKDVVIEPPLQPLTGENLRYKTANTSDDAGLDIKANGLWDCNHQSAFFDDRMFNPLAGSYHNKPMSTC